MPDSRPHNRVHGDDTIDNINPRGTPFQEIVEKRLSRRDALRGSLGMAVGTLFAGAGLAACGSSSTPTVEDAGDDTPSPEPSTQLNFESVAGSDLDQLHVADGYQTQVLIPWGTGILGSYPEFDDTGATTNTSTEQAQQIGTNHDGMYFFPIDGSSERGVLVLNHEYTNSGTLYGDAGRSEDATGAPTDADQVRKDINCHGVSVVELIKGSDGTWFPLNTGYNRRITAATPMMLTGPAAGDPLMVTPYDPSGMATRGTVNNCGNGTTPWGTYLTCEENIQGYLTDQSATVSPEKARYGINAGGFGYRWANVAGDPTEVDREFERWDTTPTGAGPTDDFRNEANCFGWMVEIDPMDPTSTPKKRTAMGRFRHEGSATSRPITGQPLAFYMGDDARFEYIYKFVTADNWDPTSPPADMLDRGTLYVARFDADGTGEWLALDYASNATLQANFASQAEVLIYARIAADLLDATPMDRPEWSTVDQQTGEIYLTLTNNTRRGNTGQPGSDAANPRAPNSHGHIIRFKEDGDRADATTFTWTIFVFGSEASGDADQNRSGLTLDNEFASPDGLWMDPRGLLWIQTDNGAPLDSNSNDQVLAVLPSELPGERTVTPTTQDHLRRLFVGPAGCEVTGITMTPDYKTMFINIQHPRGEWPGYGGSIPRSGTVAISRVDGGTIGI